MIEKSEIEEYTNALQASVLAYLAMQSEVSVTRWKQKITYIRGQHGQEGQWA
jgi:hypothetical protein